MARIRVLLCLLFLVALPLQGWTASAMRHAILASHESAMQAAMDEDANSNFIQTGVPGSGGMDESCLDAPSSDGCGIVCCAITDPNPVIFAVFPRAGLTEPIVLIEPRSAPIPHKPPRT
jgi:hypothetical protein